MVPWTNVSQQTDSQPVQPLLHSSRLWQTDRQTCRPYYVHHLQQQATSMHILSPCMQCGLIITKGRRILTKGRIAVLSPLMARMDSSDVDTHLIYASLGTHGSSRKRHLNRFIRFCHNHQLVTPRGCEWTHPTLTLSNTCFLGLRWVSSVNGISGQF